MARHLKYHFLSIKANSAPVRKQGFDYILFDQNNLREGGGHRKIKLVQVYVVF